MFKDCLLSNYKIPTLNINTIKNITKDSDVILWNGPLGLIENTKFSKGSVDIAKYLSKSIHKNFNVGRWGGEEFIVLMKHTNIDQAKEIMDELRINTSKESFSHGNINQSFTISIGISQWYDDTDDFESLFIKADKALYRAKKAGRNTVEY